MTQKDITLFILRLLLTIIIIVSCSLIARKLPTLGGLIAAAPITTLLVFLWIYSFEPTDYDTLSLYVKGVLWGIVPSICFFVAAHLCFKSKLPVPAALAASSFVWLVSAVIHQLLLGKFGT
jgi:uncharacterized membrane protein (GlpM family)